MFSGIQNKSKINPKKIQTLAFVLAKFYAIAINLSRNGMEIKRKIELFAATNRRYIVRQQPTEQQADCVSCGNAMLTAEEIARVFNITQRNVFQYVEAGTVHFTELAEGGAALICIASFADASGGRVQDDTDPKSIGL